MTPARLVMLGLVAVGFAALDLRAGIGPHDEGLMLQWGRRIAGGEWPYRDFWCNYLPGQPVLQALLGSSLLAWRIVRIATGGAAAVLAYLLVRRETDNDRWALAGWAAAACAMAWPLTPGPNASAVTLALGALLAARSGGSDGAAGADGAAAARGAAWRGAGRGGAVRPGAGALAGALAGLAFLFRPEIGVAAAIGAAVLARDSAESAGPRRAWVRPLVVAAAVALAGMVPFLLVAPGDFLSQTFGFAGQQHLQRLPFPWAPHTLDPNKVLEREFPLILMVATAGWAAVAIPRNRAGGWALAPLVVAGVAYLLARTDEFHLMPLAVVLAVGLAAAGATDPRRGVRVALAGALALMVLYGVDRQYGKVRDAGDLVAVDLPGAEGVRAGLHDAPALKDLAEAVAHRSRPGDPILSAPPRYDRVRVGDTLLYVLLDRRNPTRYDVVQPGVVTQASVQREMIRDLERSGTRLVVRWEAPVAREPEPNGSGRSSGVRLLDRWIAANFRRAGRYGDYLLLQRR